MRLTRVLSGIWVFGFVTGALLSTASLNAQTPLNPCIGSESIWVNDYQLTGVDGQIFCSTLYQGQLIIGGSFRIAGTDTVNGLAAWQGDHWQVLGAAPVDYPGLGGVDPQPIVYAMTEYQGRLYIGGTFGEISGVQFSNLACWDGSSWQALPFHLQGFDVWSVRSLATHNDTLLIGGTFKYLDQEWAPGLACWDGTNASAYPPPPSTPLGYSTIVTSIESYDGDVYAAGLLSISDDTDGDKIVVARWNGQSWTSLDGGIPFPPFFEYIPVADMAVYQGSLLIAGFFTQAGDLVCSNLASWDGSSWSTSLGFVGPTDASEVRALCVSGDSLVIGGWFQDVDGVPADNVAVYRDGGWTAPSGLDGWVNTITRAPSGLMVGGRFPTDTEGHPLGNIARLAGFSWTPYSLGQGMNDRVYCLYSDGSAVIAGGAFTVAGSTPASCLARFENESWHAFGSGITKNYSYNGVRALASYQGSLIAGGDFLLAGGVSVKGLAGWDGQWRSLGFNAAPDEFGPYVHSLTTFGGELIVGGRFSPAGAVTSGSIAAWDGALWHGLGSGFDDPVNALIVYNDTLIAGGDFIFSGAVRLDHVARWTGVDWVPMGAGFNGAVHSLTIWNGQLIAGGSFSSSGMAVTRGVAAWNGTDWAEIGGGVQGAVLSMSFCGDQLLLGGLMRSAAGLPVNRLAAWNGSSWNDVAGGVNGDVRAVIPMSGGLMAGGHFTETNTGPSMYLAAIREPVGITPLEIVATWEGESVHLLITIGDPVAYSGVHVYRGELSSGQRLTIVPLSSESEVSFVDDQPGSGSPQYYIEVISRSGKVESHGPYSPPRRPLYAPGIRVLITSGMPFSDKVTFVVALEAHTPLEVDIFDVLGRHIRSVANGPFEPGRHSLEWNGRDTEGVLMSSGLYLIRFSYPGGQLLHKLTMVR